MSKNYKVCILVLAALHYIGWIVYYFGAANVFMICHLKKCPILTQKSTQERKNKQMSGIIHIKYIF